MKRGVFHGPVAGQETPQSILVAWLVTELRSELLEQTCLKDFAIAYRALAIATFGAPLVEQVKAIAVKGCNASDTQGANLAANEIVDLLQLTKDQQKSPRNKDLVATTRKVNLVLRGNQVVMANPVLPVTSPTP